MLLSKEAFIAENCQILDCEFGYYVEIAKNNHIQESQILVSVIPVKIAKSFIHK